MPSKMTMQSGERFLVTAEKREPRAAFSAVASESQVQYIKLYHEFRGSELTVVCVSRKVQIFISDSDHGQRLSRTQHFSDLSCSSRLA